MSLVSPVSTGLWGSPSTLQAIYQHSTSAAASVLAGGLELGGLQAGGAASTLSSVSTAVSELMKNIGGGLENDQTLKLLVTMLILMALLQKPSGDQASTATSALKALSSLGNGGSQSITMASCSTTVAIYQSSSTAIAGSWDTSSQPGKLPLSLQGGQLNLLS